MSEPVHYRLRLIEDPARATRVLVAAAAVTLVLAGIGALAAGHSKTQAPFGNHPIAAKEPGQPISVAH
jgi:hypothetical protein